MIVGLYTWEMFEVSFREKFNPPAMLDIFVNAFISYMHNDMCVSEYAVKFVDLSNYDPYMVFNLRLKYQFLSMDLISTWEVGSLSTKVIPWKTL